MVDGWLFVQGTEGGVYCKRTAYHSQATREGPWGRGAVWAIMTIPVLVVLLCRTLLVLLQLLEGTLR